MGDRLKMMMERQQEFQDTAFGSVEDDERRVAISKDLMLHLHSECSEYMAELDWNPKRRASGKVIRKNLLTQNIDILKLCMALACTWGFTDEDVFKTFVEKSQVVEQRYQQEFPLQYLVKSGAKVVAIDIDGVLSDYPRCLYEWMSDRIAGFPKFDTTELDPFKAFDGKVPPLTITYLKDQYRQSGAKRTLPLVQGAAGFTHAIHSMDYKVVLLTSRPAERYKNMFADTMFWLKTSHIYFDAVLWDENKECRLVEEFCDRVVLFIDDDMQNTTSVSASGIPVWNFKENNSFPQILEWLEKTHE